jgi:hypothetical protein
MPITIVFASVVCRVAVNLVNQYCRRDYSIPAFGPPLLRDSDYLSVAAEVYTPLQMHDYFESPRTSSGKTID